MKQKAIKFSEENLDAIDMVKKEYYFNSDADTIRFLIGLGLKEIESGGEHRMRLERIERALYNNGFL